MKKIDKKHFFCQKVAIHKIDACLYVRLSAWLILDTWPSRNCHLNCKKLPKTWHFWKKNDKIVIFFQKMPMQFFGKKRQVSGNFLTFKWQFSGGSAWDTLISLVTDPVIAEISGTHIWSDWPPSETNPRLFKMRFHYILAQFVANFDIPIVSEHDHTQWTRGLSVFNLYCEYPQWNNTQFIYS